MQIWNVDRKLELTQQYTGSAYWMIDVCFSPDGSKVVTLCDSIEVLIVLYSPKLGNEEIYDVSCGETLMN